MPVLLPTSSAIGRLLPLVGSTIRLDEPGHGATDNTGEVHEDGEEDDH